MLGKLIIGGRMQFNDINPKSLQFGASSVRPSLKSQKKLWSTGPIHLYSWAMTAQGCPSKNLTMTFRLELNETELNKAAARLDPTEYEVEFGLQTFKTSSFE